MSRARPRIKKRGLSWQVDFGRVPRPDGSVFQDRKSFKTRAEAEEELAARGFESKNRRVRLLDLGDEQRQDILGALKVLDGASRLTEAADFFMKHANPARGARGLADVAAEYLEGKRRAGRRLATVTDAEVKVNRFVREIGKEHVHEVMTPDIEAWLNTQEFTPATWNSYRVAVAGLLAYATKRGYVAQNAAAAIEAVEFDQAVPQVMDVPDVQKIMRAAETDFPDMIPHVAVGFFAGLRSAELEGLQWDQVDLDERIITVTPATAKKRRMRHVEIADNLLEWLRPYWKPSGPVFYSRRYFRRVRKLADVEWAKNVMRHSFASYALAEWQDAAKVSLMLGHQRADVLFSNYRNIKTISGRNVTAKLAGEYWRIKPMKSADNLIELVIE
jgi:integrase